MGPPLYSARRNLPPPDVTSPESDTEASDSELSEHSSMPSLGSPPSSPRFTDSHELDSVSEPSPPSDAVDRPIHAMSSPPLNPTPGTRLETYAGGAWVQQIQPLTPQLNVLD